MKGARSCFFFLQIKSDNALKTLIFWPQVCWLFIYSKYKRKRQNMELSMLRGKGMKWEKHFILEDFFFGDWMLMRVIIIICCLCSCCFGSLGSASILQHVEKQLILLTRKAKLHMAGQVAFCSSFNLLDNGRFSKQQLFMPKSSPMLVRRSCFLI